ncbi:hypothetical protein F4777DRAFT_94326 [Nemania sp. FL0916]|nr:hypothetical protein F4777DRAFT_94326 [Nemania sp. FL0916]
MADNNAESIAKAPVASTDAEAPAAAGGLPPITKEPVATAEATMAPSAPIEPTPQEAVAPSSDTAAQPETSTAAHVQQESESVDKASAPDAVAPQSEKPSDPIPAAEPLSTTAETATSVAETGVLTDSNNTVEPPKPVSLEEIRDEDLPDAKPLEPAKPAEEALKTDATAPVDAPAAATTKIAAADSASAESNNVANGKKRKADEVEDAAKPETNSAADEDMEPPEKKPKTNGTTTNGAARKPGRPRKDKKAAAPVGRTARKTRSQGAAD